MKILFLKDVGGVGRSGEIKEVADGYALNSLIPNGSAVQATPEKIQAHAVATQREQQTREKEEQVLTAKLQSLEGARIEITARATEKGGLFKSLGVPDIQKAIRERKGTELPAETILLEKPIKELGDHELELKTAGVKVRLTVVIKKAD